MANLRRAGVSEAGEGERLERANEARKSTIIGRMAAAGGAAGFFFGVLQFDVLQEVIPFGGGKGWRVALAIGFTLSYLAMAGVGLKLARYNDEVELLNEYKATTAAALAYLVVYPIWYVLWQADLVREPMHVVIFFLFGLGVTAASIFYRVR